MKQYIHTNTLVLLEEYPFLKRFVGNYQRAFVTRFDRGMLDYDPGTEYVGWGYERTGYLDLIDRNGSVVYRVGQRGFWGWLRQFIHSRLGGGTESLREALENMSVQQRREVAYGIIVEFYPSQRIQLYKLPKGYRTADEWLTDIKQAEKAQFNKAMGF